MASCHWEIKGETIGQWGLNLWRFSCSLRPSKSSADNVSTFNDKNCSIHEIVRDLLALENIMDDIDINNSHSSGILCYSY